MPPKMPPGGWPIEFIAQVIGVDPEKLRKSENAYLDGFYLRQGRFVENAEGVIRHAAKEFHYDVTTALDLWYQQQNTPEFLKGMAAGGSPSAQVDGRTLDPVTQQKIEQSVAALKQDQARGTEVLVQAVVDLLGIVAVQQQQIVELARRLDSSTVAEVQSRIHEQASDHLHKVLLSSAKALKDLGTPVGSVTAGTVVHKGSVTVTRASNSKEHDSSKAMDESRDALKVDVGAEVTGVMKKLAGVGVNVKVNTTNVEKRMQELAHQKEVATSESFKGELEIQYQGVSVTIGK